MNRIQLANRFLSGASEIVDVCRFPRARKVMEVLSCYALHAPVAEGTICIDTRNRAISPQPLYRLVPLLPEDSKVSPGWAEIVNRIGAAEVIINMQLITIKYHAPISKCICGLLLLHEGEHVRALIESPRNLRDQKVLIEDEIAVHNFQHTLQSQIGGKPYKSSLESLINDFTRNQYLRQDGTFLIPVCKNPIRELDQAFGPAESEYEYNLRTTMLWVHASMEYLNRKAPKGMASQAQSAFFRSYYSDLINRNTHSS